MVIELDYRSLNRLIDVLNWLWRRNGRNYRLFAPYGLSSDGKRVQKFQPDMVGPPVKEMTIGRAVGLVKRAKLKISLERLFSGREPMQDLLPIADE